MFGCVFLRKPYETSLIKAKLIMVHNFHKLIGFASRDREKKCTTKLLNILFDLIEFVVLINFKSFYHFMHFSNERHDHSAI